MIVKAAIGVLAAIALVVLYQGMRHEQAAVNPLAPVDAKKILATLNAYHLRCNNVTTYTPLGKSRDGQWDTYVALCGDGGHYIYFENRKAEKVGAVSCTDAAFKTGYRCP